MESPVVLDKPPEYHGNDRGFPFEDEEASGAWSELAARHPDIAARLRQRPASATWARKRRPSSQDATDDFGENFSGFDGRFPFDDIPPEFREHFPSHWNRRFGSREEAPPQPPPSASPPQPPQPSQPSQTPQTPPQQTAATQTDTHTQTEPQADPAHSLPQYGLRNTVDLGQKSPADPRLVDGPERAPRSMSAPPEPRSPRDMSAPPPAEPGNVRHIPIFVEGRDEPVISRGEPSPAPAASHAPHAPHIDHDAYFADDTPSFHHPPNFTRAFGTPSGKPYRPGQQPFMQQKVYPQAAFNRAPSPQRDRFPRPPQPAPPHSSPPTHEEPFVKVPVHHQQTAAPPRAPPAAAAAPPQREATPPYVPPKPVVNDPITQILSIQNDVLNLMNEVENFTGTKRDKRYMFLDEMLTRNLIKLDNIETEGKENIRLARKEAIRCIQKCIAVLEAKAEKNGNPQQQQAAADVHMTNEEAPVDGELEMKEEADPQTTETLNDDESKPHTEPLLQEEPAPPEPEATPADSHTQEHKPSTEKPEEQTQQVENKPSPKKKVVKKRDKSKDKAAADSAEAKDSDKVEKVEVMQVDNKGDQTEQVMEVDGAASQ